MCLAVYFKDVGSPHALLKLLDERGYDATLFNRSVTRLGIGRVHFGKAPMPSKVTTLVSGSYPFLQKVALQHHSGRILFLLDEPWRGKTTPSPSKFASWRRFKPTQFGGSIRYPVLIGWSGFELTPHGSTLGRTIGHVLDHGIRPAFLDVSVVDSLGALTQEFYVSESLLDPCHLDRPVAYQTAYSSSRWGSRRLSPEELGIAFGLPARLSLGGLEASMFPFVPLQVLVGCLISLSHSDSPVLQPLSTPTSRLLEPVPTSSWLPLIQKRLDHAWIDHTAVSAKAAKND
jgi:hypothetical protein